MFMRAICTQTEAIIQKAELLLSGAQYGLVSMTIKERKDPPVNQTSLLFYPIYLLLKQTTTLFFSLYAAHYTLPVAFLPAATTTCLFVNLCLSVCLSDEVIGDECMEASVILANTVNF